MDVSAKGTTAAAIVEACEAKGVNVRPIDDKTVGLSFGESITQGDVVALVRYNASPFVGSQDCLCALLGEARLISNFLFASCISF